MGTGCVRYSGRGSPGRPYRIWCLRNYLIINKQKIFSTFFVLCACFFVLCGVLYIQSLEITTAPHNTTHNPAQPPPAGKAGKRKQATAQHNPRPAQHNPAGRTTRKAQP